MAAKEKVGKLPRPRDWRLVQRNKALLVILAYLEIFGYVQLAKPFCSSEQHTLPPSSRLAAGYPCSGTLAEKVLYLALRPGQVYKDYLNLQPQDCWVSASAACMLLRMLMALVWRGSTRVVWASAAHRLVAPLTLMAWLLASGQEPSTLAIWFVWSWPLLDCTYVMIFPTGFIPEVWYGAASFVTSAVIGWRIRSLHPHISVSFPAQLLVCAMSTAWALYVQAPRCRQRKQQQQLKQIVGACGDASAAGSSGVAASWGRRAPEEGEQAEGEATGCRNLTVHVPDYNGHALSRAETSGQRLWTRNQEARAQGNRSMATVVGGASAATGEAAQVQAAVTRLETMISPRCGESTIITRSLATSTDAFLTNALLPAASFYPSCTLPSEDLHDLQGAMAEAALGSCTIARSVDWEAASGGTLQDTISAPEPRPECPSSVAAGASSLALGMLSEPVVGLTPLGACGTETAAGIRRRQVSGAVVAAPRHRYRRGAAATALESGAQTHAVVSRALTPEHATPLVLAVRQGDGLDGSSPRFTLQLAGLPTEPAAAGRSATSSSYLPVLRIVRLQVKIHGADPEHVASGYEERISQVVAAAGYELESVYLRRGCIELVVDARAWQDVASETTSSLMAADALATAPSATNSPCELPLAALNGCPEDANRGAAITVANGPRLVSGRGIGRGGAISRLVVLDVRAATSSPRAFSGAGRGSGSFTAVSELGSRQLLSAECLHLTAVAPCDAPIAGVAAITSPKQLSCASSIDAPVETPPSGIPAIDARAPSKGTSAILGAIVDDGCGDGEPSTDIDIGALIRALHLPDFDASDAGNIVDLMYCTEEPAAGRGMAADAYAGPGDTAFAQCMSQQQHGWEGLQSSRPTDRVSNDAQQEWHLRQQQTSSGDEDVAGPALLGDSAPSPHPATTAPSGAFPRAAMTTPWVVNVYPRVLVTGPTVQSGSQRLSGGDPYPGAGGSGGGRQYSGTDAIGDGGEWSINGDVRSDTASGTDSARGGESYAAPAAAPVPVPEDMVAGPFRIEVVVWWPDEPAAASPSPEHCAAIVSDPTSSAPGVFLGIDSSCRDCEAPVERWRSSHATESLSTATATAGAGVSLSSTGGMPRSPCAPMRPSLDQLELLLRCRGHHLSARMVAVTPVELALAATEPSQMTADAVRSLADGTVLQYSLEVPFLPAMPGLLLVEAIGIAVVPVLLLGNELAAAAELQAAVDNWYGNADEVEDLLLDVATFVAEIADATHALSAWELRPAGTLLTTNALHGGHVLLAADVPAAADISAAAAAPFPEGVTEGQLGGRTGGGAAVDALYGGSVRGPIMLHPRVVNLGCHLLSFALRSGWTACVALLRAQLSAAAASVPLPPSSFHPLLPPNPTHAETTSSSCPGTPWTLPHGFFYKALSQRPPAEVSSGVVTAGDPVMAATAAGAAASGLGAGGADSVSWPLDSRLDATARDPEADLPCIGGAQMASGADDNALYGGGAFAVAHAAPAPASSTLSVFDSMQETRKPLSSKVVKASEQGPNSEEADWQGNQQAGGILAGGTCCCGGHGEHHGRLQHLRLRQASASAAAVAACGKGAAAAAATAVASLLAARVAAEGGKKGQRAGATAGGLNVEAGTWAADGDCRLAAQVIASSVLWRLRGSAADVDAPDFREYKASWRAAPALILQWVEVLMLAAALSRLAWTWAAGAAPVLPTACTAAVTVLATAAGIASATAWVMLPRLVWVRFADQCAALRQATNCLVKLLVGWAGWPVLPCFNKYETGLGVWLMEGVVLPGACMLSPTPSLLVALAKVPLLMRSWLVLGGGAGSSHHRRTRDAVLHACGISCLSLGTAIVCHYYLRQSYRRLQLQRQHYHRRRHMMAKIE